MADAHTKARMVKTLWRLGGPRVLKTLGTPTSDPNFLRRREQTYESYFCIYCLHVARQFCMYGRLSLALSALTKAMASRAARVHGTSNTGALRIH